MVASTDIRYYVHTNSKAPQLENAFGSMLNVLDACLVNGFGSQTVESLTADNTTVTADFGRSHNFLQYQVIKIEGAVQEEFNGEHRIISVTTNTISFEIAQPASTSRASGLISCSLPPLGWEKPFANQNPSGGGKGAYRSKNTLLPSRPFLRVVDELDPLYNADWAKYAKVGIVEDMFDIDVMTGKQIPFDIANRDKNWIATGSGSNVINGWAKWYYKREGTADSITVPNAISTWIIIGCTDWFLIIPSINNDSANQTRGVYGIICFESFVDKMPWILLASNSYLNVSAHSEFYYFSELTKTFKDLIFADDDILGVRTIAFEKDENASGYSNLISNDYIVLTDTFLYSSRLKKPYGKIDCIKLLHQNLPFDDKYVFKNGNHLFIAVKQMMFLNSMIVVKLI